MRLLAENQKPPEFRKGFTVLRIPILATINSSAHKPLPPPPVVALGAPTTHGSLLCLNMVFTDDLALADVGIAMVTQQCVYRRVDCQCMLLLGCIMNNAMYQNHIGTSKGRS